MKIRAGGQFQPRNPSAAAASTRLAAGTAADAAPEAQQGSGAGDEHGLARREPVDAVHEIEQVDRPADRKRTQQVAHEAEVVRAGADLHRRNAAEPGERPGRRAHVNGQPQACSQRLAIVAKARDGNGQPAAQQRDAEVTRNDARAPQRNEPADGRHDDAEPAAAWRGCVVRAAGVGHIQPLPAQRLAPHPPGHCDRDEQRRNHDAPCDGAHDVVLARYHSAIARIPASNRTWGCQPSTCRVSLASTRNEPASLSSSARRPASRCERLDEPPRHLEKARRSPQPAGDCVEQFRQRDILAIRCQQHTPGGGRVIDARLEQAAEILHADEAAPCLEPRERQRQATVHQP